MRSLEITPDLVDTIRKRVEAEWPGYPEQWSVANDPANVPTPSPEALERKAYWKGLSAKVDKLVAETPVGQRLSPEDTTLVLALLASPGLPDAHPARKLLLSTHNDSVPG